MLDGLNKYEKRDTRRVSRHRLGATVVDLHPERESYAMVQKNLGLRHRPPNLAGLTHFRVMRTGKKARIRY